MSPGVQPSVPAVLGAVSRALVPDVPESAIPERVCETVTASDCFAFAWLGRYDPETDAVQPAAARSATESLDGESDAEAAPPRELTDEAIESRDLVVRQDLDDDPHCEACRDHARHHGYRHAACLPLVHEETLYGVLLLATTQPDVFGTADRASLTELGRTVAYALETADASTGPLGTDGEDGAADLTGLPAGPEQKYRLYETIISSTPDLVYAFDLDYRFVFANEAVLEMWDMSLEESLGKTLREIGYEPWHADMHEREIDEVVETKEPVRGEVGFEHAELGHRIYEYIFAPVLDEDGEVEAIAGTTRDVTERKQTEDALQQSEERFRALVTASSDVVYRMDPAWDQMQELEGQGFLDDTTEPTSDWVEKYIHPDERERVFDAIDEAIRTESTFELEHRVEQADGSVGWTFSRAVPMLDDDGEIVEWIGMATDVTEQKARERELERALDLLEKTEHIADVGGWEIDVETQDVFWTDYVFELLDVDADEEPPLAEAIDMYHEADRPAVEAAVENALEAGEPFDIEARIRTDGSDIRWLRLQGVPETEDGEVVTLRGAAQDVTERRKRERRLEELVEKLETSNERLEQFAYAASHDLQEPLRMVSSYLQLVERRYGDQLDEDGREFLEFAVDGADRMREMIDGLLAYSRVDTRGDALEPVDLEAIVADVRDDLQVKIEEHDAEITAGSLPRVLGDAGQLRQVFQNLFDNAIEYSGDEPPRVHVAAERADGGDEWMVSVRDEGIGIDPEDADRVFDVFQRLHDRAEYDGTGIGLALCERIVERHGGDIWVESEPGEGATFAFTLPAADASHAQ